MNIKETLLAEHSKAQAMRIFHYVGKDKERLNELFTFFLGDNYRLSQRAAWPISFIAEKHPKLFAPYLKTMLKNLQKHDIHDAVKRNTLRVFELIAIPEELEGEVYDVAYKYIFSIKEPIAVRAYSIGIVVKIAKEIPELLVELDLAFQDLREETCAGIRSRINNYYKKR